MINGNTIPRGYLVTYCYVSPDGTMPQGERPKVQIRSGYFKKLDDALDFVREDFDSLDLWDTSFVPYIKDHLELRRDKCVVDDWTAGQWVYIMPYFGKDIKIEF